MFRVLLLACFFVHVAFAGTLGQLARRTVSFETLVGSAAVTAFAQAPDGYIWIGTAEAGLMRFDGMVFEVFNTANVEVLPTENITSLCVAADGTLWIGTTGGLLTYRNRKFSQEYSTKNGLLTNLVKSVYEARDGTLWVATVMDGAYQGGLHRIRNGVVSTYTAKDGLPNADIWSLYESDDGTLWLATYGAGLVKYDGKFTVFSTEDGLAGNDVRSVCQDPSGRLWIATHDGGLSSYSEGKFKNYTTADGLSSNQLLKVLWHNNALWIGTTAGGLNRFVGGRFESLGVEDGLPDSSVGAMFADSEGNLWLGLPGALYALREGVFTSYTTREGLAFDLVCPVTPSQQGGLWIGTFGGGLSRFKDGVFKNYTIKDGLPSNKINSLLEAEDGLLWIGTYDAGLCSFDGKAFKLYPSVKAKTIKTIHSSGSALWVGTDGHGIYRLSGSSDESQVDNLTVADGLASNVVIVIIDDGQGGLWIGTDGAGLSHYDGNGFKNYTTADGLVGNKVWALYLDTDGTLWIGTDTGLSVLRNGNFYNVTRKDGLLAESVNQILDDGLGNLWFSSPRGIYRIAKDNLEAFFSHRSTSLDIVSYGREDGMVSEQCSRWFQPAGCKTPDGRLWFPTIKGLVSIELAHSAEELMPPKCFIESLVVDGMKFDFSSDIELLADMSRIEFHYGCPSFTSPEKIVFRYKLEGFDSDWRERRNSSRYVSYTNLPPGDYVFKLLARRPGGKWSTVGVSRHLRLYVPWWKSRQAVVVYILAVPVLVGGVLFLRVRTLRKINLELEAKVAEQTAALSIKVAELQRSERLFEAFMVNLPALSYMKDKDGRYVYVNRMIGKFAGFSAQQILGKTDREIFSQSFAEVFQENDRRVLEALSPMQFVESFLAPEGEKYLLSVKFPIPTEEGTTLGGISLDISERMRLERELLAANHRLNTIIQASPLGIVIFRPDGTVLRWNKAAEQIYGWTEEEITSGAAKWIVAENVSAEVQGYIDRLLAGERLIEVEIETIRKDGSCIVVRLSAVGLADSSGRIEYILGIVSDMTEKRKMRDALQRAMQAAEEAARAKSDFLANMSHEIRTPMNAIVGMTSLLLETELTTEQREFASTIRSSCETLLAIINDILDFSKIEAGQLELEEISFNLQEAIEEVLDLLSVQARTKGLELAYVVEEGVPEFVVGDPTRIKQVLVNLIGNAIKFTGSGEVSLLVKVLSSNDAQRELYFSVKDTGIGIPQDRLNSLFQAFTQVDASTTRKYGGTGLGLAISRRLVELMGGKIWVESELGRGSNFQFTVSIQAASRPAESALVSGDGTLVNKRVLVVDDNATSRRMLELQLQKWGMQVQLAASGQEALKLLEDGSFDLLLLDMQMPDMNGLELAKQISNWPKQVSAKLVMLSSVGRVRGPFAASLVKPVKAGHLRELLLEVFGRARRQHLKQTQPQLPRLSSLRILLAEDNPVNQKVTLRMLERLGYSADVVANGQEAVDALRRRQYDVVLMDVQMPVMDGFEATRRIVEEWAKEARPRIVALTAGVLKNEQEACFAAGMDDFLGKPIRLEDLNAVLERCSRLPEHPNS
ncbi:MAG: two-component regulator propeller domain-containing protein [Acidobacteriota bacterium]|nr:response regulator [Blastocatellia bacterium]MDW8411181.1 two-component regulator propeller domain-containing protein [Acidobacteriota bacterium]